MVDVIPAPDSIRDLEKLVGVYGWAHVNVSDGTLVPAQSFIPVSQLAPFAKAIGLEAHLVVANPEKYVRQAADAGCKRLIADVEALDPRLFLDAVQLEDAEAGLAIDGATEFEVIEPFLDELDFVHVLTVEAGSNTFLPECVEKIKTIHLYLPDLPISAEGGMKPETARLVTDAGATRIISSAYTAFHD